MRMSRALLVLLLLPFTATSQTVDIPDALKDWQSWVLKDTEYRSCPFIFNSNAPNEDAHICAWPGALQLTVDARTGRFQQQWRVFGKAAFIPLTGDTNYWPDKVTVNGRAASVIERQGRPTVRVEPGVHQLRGEFEWNQRPGNMAVPQQTGLIILRVNGKDIKRPDVNGNRVFLGERVQQAQSRNTITAQVYRRIIDLVPTNLETKLQIDVSGSVREELLGPILPEGFVPLNIASKLPARLEADGQLRVQVRPGRWEITLTARAPGVLNSIALPSTETNLPDTEVWSYQSVDRLRVTAAEGLPPVDPNRVQVPNNWRELPAYRIQKGQSLTILERSRGSVANANELQLRRSIWLDYTGGGFSVRDNVTGAMNSDWRLDMQSPYLLQSATENGENLLVTVGDTPEHSGIELRNSRLSIATNARIETRSAVPASGWASRFASMSATLYLPPGHQLFAAPGSDIARGSWLGEWQLLDFFLLLIITVASWKLFGRVAGLVTLAALTLSFHEGGAPTWLWLNALVAIALLRVTPVGRLRTSVRVYLGASALILTLALVPFLAEQLRVAIYPQLERQSAVYGHMPVENFSDVPMAVPVQAEMESVEIRRERKQKSSLDEIVVTGQAGSAQFSEPVTYARYASNTIVQAGPGIPDWRWNVAHLSWNGPVDAAQTLRLLILPRWAVTLLRVAMVLLLLWFAAVLAAELSNKRWKLPGGLRIGSKAAALMLALTVGVTAVPDQAYAQTQIPDANVLEELKQRLLEAPECMPRCAEILSADVTVDADAVGMNLSVVAAENVAVPLPGNATGWRPSSIQVDGTATTEVYLDTRRNFWIRLSPGRHQIRLRGSADGVDSLAIAFPAPPRVIRTRIEGWFVNGIKDRRLLSNSLQLTRLQTEEGGSGAPRWQSNRFPAFVRVNRRIEMGLDWKVTTEVVRLAPSQGAITLELPLLAGESVISEDPSISDGKLLVSMNPQQGRVRWQSNLERTSPLNLTAAANSAWHEVWHIGVGAVWHAEFSGVPESETGAVNQANNTARIAEFNPRGGETLAINATRPVAVEGTTLAFDWVIYSIEQGERSSTNELNLQYRSTRGAQHVIKLPETAEVTQVVIDDRVEPLRADKGALTLPILPGEHYIIVSWRDAAPLGLRVASPSIDIGASASNLNLELSLPHSRWLLLTTGPTRGPAVLYLSELAMLILIALILGRVSWTPLRWYHWLLLGIGFSTFNWPAFVLVAAWILATGAREHWRADTSPLAYNLKQCLLILSTIVAVITIVVSLPSGLLGSPDMHVTGNNSYGTELKLFADRTAAVLPQISALSVPMWIYKTLILGWALWLSFSLLKWLPWTWECFARDGFFKSREPEKPQPSSDA